MVTPLTTTLVCLHAESPVVLRIADECGEGEAAKWSSAAGRPRFTILPDLISHESSHTTAVAPLWH